ncbi:MAG: S-methyl-5-thioribose-1-phosphate isomerase [Spirochaetota bacterium]
MPVPTIEYAGGRVKIIDQTRLPVHKKFIDIHSAEEMWEAIKHLKIRGAPAIGIGAAFGVYLGIKDFDDHDKPGFMNKLEDTCRYMATSRPTAVNLFWALDRIKNVVRRNCHLGVPELKELVLNEAKNMITEDNRICRSIGEHGVQLIREGYSLLTHCNAGGLATAMYGTALAPIFRARELGVDIHVYVDETRPLLQGSRITAWELLEAHIPATLITDNMAAAVMYQKKVDMVIVGADRIAANGDTANKIGTLGVAVLAGEFGVPFYIAAPVSTIDLKTPTGDAIPIEERDPREVVRGFGRQTAPADVQVYNPAFDVTPARYIQGIITEKGILAPPFDRSIRQTLQK